MRSPKTLTFALPATALFFALSAWAQQKPSTQNQLQSRVRSGFADETGGRAFEQRGIDLVPAGGFLRSLKAAGASAAFLNPAGAAKSPEPASAQMPINQVQVFALLASQVPSHRLAILVKERGIDFVAKDDYLQQVRVGGGDAELIIALKSAKVTKPPTIDPAAAAKGPGLRAVEAKQAELCQHAARGAESIQRSQYAAAEAEYRAAVLLDPRNSDLHVALARALNRQRKSDEALAEAREAVRLSPNDDMAHYSVGAEFGAKGDWDDAIQEQRAALRLNPDNDLAHTGLGAALASKGDGDDAITEYREALRLNPNNYLSHFGLANALGKKGDWDGAIAEYRAALRVNPNNDLAHYNLGAALGHKGDQQGALQEVRAAYMLDPKNVLYKQSYERMLQQSHP